MSEKYPDRTNEWAKQQDALKNPKIIPPKKKNDVKTNDDKKVNK